jgi:hypothetical protein
LKRHAPQHNTTQHNTTQHNAPEVHQSKVALRIDEQVLWLEVTVHDEPVVQHGEALHDAAGVEARVVNREAVELAQQTEQLAAGHELGQHVQIVRILEGAHEVK